MDNTLPSNGEKKSGSLKNLSLKIAWLGIKTNKKLYLPYILTCIGVIMMSTILANLAYSPALKYVRGGGTLSSILGIGVFVIAAFALIFLFYTNSFLLRRRKMEFGLYNILGMGKHDISKIAACETVVIYFISMFSGLALGILLSKLAELCLLNFVETETDFIFRIMPKALRDTFIIFTAIFALLLVKSVSSVYKSKPLDLLHSESKGEIPPKSNALLAILGVLILGGAYFLAITIKKPTEALGWFFIAVVMVIIATYMLMTAGSVTLCRLLKNNKKYYYKKNHYVSVSSMMFRMKRNGAGLASICILSTMVLVMLTVAISLYAGTESVIRDRYPRMIMVKYSLRGELDSEGAEALRHDCEDRVEKLAEKRGLEPDNILSYRYFLSYVAMKKDGGNLESTDVVYDAEAQGYITFDIKAIPISDYNRITGENTVLGENEILISGYGIDDKLFKDGLTLSDGVHFTKAGGTDKLYDSGVLSISAGDEVAVAIIRNEDMVKFADYFIIPFNEDAGLPYTLSDWSQYCVFGFDTTAEYDDQYDVYTEIPNEMHGDALVSCFVRSSAADKYDFISSYGGLLFIAIILSIIFIFAAILIIYYKQISEGYEDQSRFGIMQKVGMTKKDIKESINSQMLTVFFAPPVFAGIHLSFAFPFLWKIIALFGLNDKKFILLVCLALYTVFVLLYMVIYKITTGAYYGIVSGVKRS